MDKKFFKIVIPNYNNEVWLDKCLSSVLNQTFKDYEVIVVDDMSTDNSVEVIKKYPFHLIELTEKRYNGGSRNVGIKYPIECEYLFFLDSDDWLASDDVLEELHDFIIKNNYPNCIRLPFKINHDGDKYLDVQLNENNIGDMVKSCFVACWTKCVKRDIFPLFPENTLMEDKVQHIKTCDIVGSVIPFDKMCVVYNKNNTNSCSAEMNHDLQNSKWKSSMYRFIADLMDFRCKTVVCEERRKNTLNKALSDAKEGKFIQ